MPELEKRRRCSPCSLILRRLTCAEECHHHDCWSERVARGHAARQEARVSRGRAIRWRGALHGEKRRSRAAGGSIAEIMRLSEGALNVGRLQPFAELVEVRSEAQTGSCGRTCLRIHRRSRFHTSPRSSRSTKSASALCLLDHGCCKKLAIGSSRQLDQHWRH